MPPRNNSLVSRINAVTGAGTRTSRLPANARLGNQARALRSASVLMNRRNWTPAMRRAERNFSRRRSQGGSGG